MNKIKIKTLTLGPMANNTYIVSSTGRECIIVDPGWEICEIENFLKNNDLKPSFVLLTHGHFDHCKDLNLLLTHFDLWVFIHKADAFMLENIDKKYIKTFGSNHCFSIKSFPVAVICTPGHTMGSCCFLIGNNLFTGDTLFVGQCGRVDFPYSDHEKMYESLIKLSRMSPDIKIFPGHMAETSTIGNEIKTNSCLKLALKSKEDFLEAMR